MLHCLKPRPTVRCSKLKANAIYSNAPPWYPKGAVVMAPEILLGEKYNEMIDVFSCVAYDAWASYKKLSKNGSESGANRKSGIYLGLRSSPPSESGYGEDSTR